MVYSAEIQGSGSALEHFNNWTKAVEKSVETDEQGRHGYLYLDLAHRPGEADAKVLTAEQYGKIKSPMHRFTLLNITAFTLITYQDACRAANQDRQPSVSEKTLDALRGMIKKHDEKIDAKNTLYAFFILLFERIGNVFGGKGFHTDAEVATACVNRLNANTAATHEENREDSAPEVSSTATEDVSSAPSSQPAVGETIEEVPEPETEESGQLSVYNAALKRDYTSLETAKGFFQREKTSCIRILGQDNFRFQEAITSVSEIERILGCESTSLKEQLQTTIRAFKCLKAAIDIADGLDEEVDLAFVEQVRNATADAQANSGTIIQILTQVNAQAKAQCTVWSTDLDDLKCEFENEEEDGARIDAILDRLDELGDQKRRLETLLIFLESAIEKIQEVFQPASEDQQRLSSLTLERINMALDFVNTWNTVQAGLQNLSSSES